MHDWNVVATVQSQGFNRACEVLGRFGPVHRTGFLNVLVMSVEDVGEFLDGLRQWTSDDPQAGDVLARAMPVAHRFAFQTVEEFESRMRESVPVWAPALAGKAFHVRMHRRGFKGRISSQGTERLLSEGILEALEQAGTLGHITFQDPDAILALETVGNQGGMSLWSREEMQKYPFLKLD